MDTEHFCWNFFNIEQQINLLLCENSNYEIVHCQEQQEMVLKKLISRIFSRTVESCTGELPRDKVYNWDPDRNQHALDTETGPRSESLEKLCRHGSATLPWAAEDGAQGVRVNAQDVLMGVNHQVITLNLQVRPLFLVVEPAGAG